MLAPLCEIYLFTLNVLPHDAMLARYMLGIYLVACLSVCKPVLSRNDCADRAGLMYMDAFSSLSSLCFREIRLSPKITVFLSETLSRTPDLKNSATAFKSIVFLTNRSTVELVNPTWAHTYDGRRAVAYSDTVHASRTHSLLHVRQQ